MRTLLTTLLLLAAAPALAEAPALASCDRLAAQVYDALERRDDMRDEAYTAIMWSRMDAEAARAAGDGEACLAHLDFPRRALGLAEPNATGGAPESGG